MRLHARLILMIVIAAGPALGLLVYSQFDTRASQIAEIHRRAQETARSAAIYSAATIQGMRSVLVGIGPLLPRFETDRQLCSEIARHLNGRLENIVSFAAFDQSGRVLCGNPQVSPNFDNRTRQVLADGSRSSSMSVVEVGEPDTAAVVGLIEPVHREGGIGGFVAIALSLEWLNEEAERYPLPGDATLTLVGRDGRILARRPDVGNWLGKRLPESILQAVQSTAEGTLEIIGLDSRPRIAAFAPVPRLTDDLFVLIGIDRDQQLAAVRRMALRNTTALVLIVLAIAATAIASWQTAGSLLRRERQLADAKAAAERVAANQQRIADTIGHDLRNSVQTLVSFLRNLRRNSERPPDPSVMPYVARAVGDLRSSLDMLIRASRLEAGSLEPHRRTVQLSTFLKKLLDDWQFYAETKGLSLNLVAGAEMVETDPDLLRTILSNLVSNAIKHTDAGGVTVSVEPDASGHTCISVQDTGAGIPPQKAALIFEAFSRLEPEKTEGLGLGLSIAKRTADLLGCELALDRDERAGSRFFVKCRAKAATLAADEHPRHKIAANPASADAAFR